MIRRSKIALLGAMVAGFAITDVGSAFAQLDEIIVVARKREESLQTVPVAVTAFSGDELINQGVFDLSDIGAQTPGLQIPAVSQGSPSGLIVNLRGQTAADLLLTVDPAVSAYLDGAPLQHGFGFRSNFFDMERVEVLKGPQGTLYGKNNTGGAINLISKKANYDGMHGYVKVDAGNYRNIDITGAVNLPIIEDQLAVRAAFQRNDRRGYGRQNGQCFDLNGAAVGDACAGTQRLGDDDEWNFRGNLIFDPTESVRVSIVGDYSRIRQNDNVINLVGWLDGSAEGTAQAASELFSSGAAANALITGTIIPSSDADPYKTVGSDDTFDNSTVWGVAGTIEIDLDDTTMLKSITSYRDFSNDRNTEIGGTPFIIHESPQKAWGNIITQEFNISGEGAEGALRWLGGVFYSNESGQDGSTSRARPAASSAAFGAIRGKVENKAWAVFAQTDYDLTEELTLTAGGRYTEERRDLISWNHAIFTIGGWDPATKTLVPGPAFPGGDVLCLTGGGFRAIDNVENYRDAAANPGCRLDFPTLSSSGWSWTFGLDYEVTEDIFAYARTARGFRSGGNNLRVIATSPIADIATSQVGPEFARDIEVGVKADWLDGRLRTNLAVFQVKYSGKQESVIIPGVVLTTALQNAAEAKVRGVELEAFANPFEGLTFRGTMGWIEPKYKEYLAAEPNGDGLGVLAAVNRAGDVFDDTREWTYSLSGRYEAPVNSHGTLGLQVDWSWQSEAQQDPYATIVQAARAAPFGTSQTELLAIDERGRRSYGLLNVRVDYEIEDWDANIAFYATNLLDETVWQQGASVASRQYVSQLVGEPRMWGFQVTKRFGG